MKRALSLILAVALLLTVIPWCIPAKVEAAGVSRYSVLVLDISGSETFTSGGTTIYQAQTAVQYVREAAVSFLKDMALTSGDNHVAVVVYDEGARIVSEFTEDMDALANKVRGISESYDNDRSVNAGLELAHDLIKGIDDANAIKNVVLFTTGMTDEGPSNYEGRYSEETVGSSWYHSGTGIHLYAYSNSAYETAQALKQDATIYTLGLFQTMEQMPEAGQSVAEFFRLFTKDLASAENCFYDVTDPAQLEFAFGEIAGDIAAVSGKFKYAGQIFEKEDGKDTESEYWYSDGYFFKRSSIYNPSLATMSLCLELSSWSSHEKENWYEPDYDPEDPDYWQDKLVNIKTLLLGDPNRYEGYEGLGFDYFAANADWEQEPKTNSIGVCAARKQITDRYGNAYTLVAVAVRGGGYGSEWGGNFEIGENGDHKGFAAARDKVLDFLDDYLEDLGSDESKELKLWIVGYSRAGATANMVAGTLNDNPTRLGYTVGAEDIYCYTFEAPQGVYMTHLKGNYENIHNVINTNDLVPFVAPNSWGFYRYNHQSSRYFPSRYTTGEKTFQKQYQAMKDQLEEMGFGRIDMQAAGKDFSYEIQEYSNQKKLYIDKSKFLPGGSPLWWWEDSRITTHEALDNVVDFLAEDALKNREFYEENLQYSLSTALSILMHYNGAGAGLEDFAAENLSQDDLIRMFKEFFTVDNIMYILAPVFSLNPFKSLEDRKEEVTDRTMEVLGRVFKPLGEADKAIDALGVILTNVLWEVAQEAWNNNTDSINTMLQAVDVLATTGMQPHFPEITLAWCRSLDPNYNSDVTPDKGSAVTRIVRINCPVNVFVYDSDGAVVASIVDDQPVEDSLLVCYINDDGEKVFYLPGDSEYTIDIIARNDCTVSYTVGEYSMVYGQMVSTQSYFDIPLNNGETMNARVSAASDEALEENSTHGTGAYYSLYRYGDELPASEYYAGPQAEEKVNVMLMVEGNGGYVSGAGSYHRGSYAQLEAQTLPGGTFLGWYCGGQLLSQESVYRLAVRDGMDIVAKFSELEMYELKLKADEGGVIRGAEGPFPAGTQISFVAEAKKGYEFVGWEIKGGKLESKSDAENSLTMPEGNVTVTAKFRKIGEQTPVAKEFPTKLLLGGGLILAGMLCVLAGVIGLNRKLNGKKRK